MMKKGVSNQAIYRKDYTPYPWHLDHVDLHFSIADEGTQVQARLAFEAREAGVDRLVLDGRNLRLLRICIDGVELDRDRYVIEGEKMTIEGLPERFELETLVEIDPAANTALEGLYQAGEFLLTQCEAEGFRKITWFPDRPDVMSRYGVTVEADRARYPVLLSNGNLVAEEDAGGGRHRVRWEDPFPKPSYLFALVAGELVHVEDHFTTCHGREVTLRVYVEPGNEDRCDHAMASLVNAMRWDEERFGLEYDLDIYNIVATDAFNMGAMENKSLNIFNSKYVLARPDTATDWDYQAIEGVIGHEYFHNWTGNRVTCRDWFQLTLKEGLTVFRDEEFSADMQSRAVKRIQDVRELRNRQFPEDAGPMAHPIRPDRYIEINNFYTATVYQKGATVIRMYHTLLGEEGFQKGMRLYFERHDGQAVTCDDFRAAMADANGFDLDRFGRWYAQSGTPEVHVGIGHDTDSGTLTVTLRQHTAPTPDQPDKLPLVIPFAIGMLDPDGREIALQREGEPGAGGTTRVLVLEEPEQSFTFVGIHQPVVPSLLRDFSAPVKVRYPYRLSELSHLIAHDPEPFARWEAAQTMAQRCILEQVGSLAAGKQMLLEPALVNAFAGLLDDREADPALVAEALALPSEDYLAVQMEVVDVDGIHAARRFIRRGLAAALEERLMRHYRSLRDDTGYRNDPDAIARRALRNACLAYLVTLPEGHRLATAQLSSSDNMTDTLAALRGLVMTDAPAVTDALAAFGARWSGNSLVMDKWFTIQAMKPGAATLEDVRRLVAHPEFSLRRPNKVRALIGAFCMANPTAFHAADGSGYDFLAEQVVALDALNPQIAARMVAAFNRWRRYDAARGSLMRKALKRIAAAHGLSPDVSEIVGNALK